MFAECIKKTIHPATWAVVGQWTDPNLGPLMGHLGTAFAVNHKGHMLTCAHVTMKQIAGGPLVELDEIRVFQPELGPTMHKATVVDRDAGRDIALLKIDDAGVKTAPAFFTRERIPWGRACCAFGHPLSVIDAGTQMMRVFTRAAGGMVSMPYEGPIEPGGKAVDLYELDFFTHGGASGGPVFLRSGDVFAFVRASLLTDDGHGKRIRSNLSVAVDINEAVEFLKPSNINLQFRGGARR
jgi:S1-C subfamily serine protease